MRKFLVKRLVPFIRENVNLTINANTKPNGRLDVLVVVRLFGITLVNETLQV